MTDTPRPRECISKGILADLMLTCNQIIDDPQHEKEIVRLTSATGDLFYAMGNKNELRSLISSDVEEIIASVIGVRQNPMFDELKDVVSSFKEFGNAIDLLFIGDRSMNMNSCLYSLDGTMIEDSVLIPHILINFDTLQNRGREFVSTLPRLNSKINDDTCRIYYSTFHQAETLPNELAHTLESFMYRHSHDIKSLIDKQSDDIDCADPFVRRQRKIQIDQKLKIMMLAERCIVAILEAHREFKELTSRCPEGVEMMDSDSS